MSAPPGSDDLGDPSSSDNESDAGTGKGSSRAPRAPTSAGVPLGSRISLCLAASSYPRVAVSSDFTGYEPGSVAHALATNATDGDADVCTRWRALTEFTIEGHELRGFEVRMSWGAGQAEVQQAVQETSGHCSFLGAPKSRKKLPASTTSEPACCMRWANGLWSLKERCCER